MSGGGVQALELVVLLLLVFVAVFGGLARRLQMPYPIGLVIGGLLLSLVPAIPRISLDPHVVFFVLLPPLVYGAAWMTSWRDFSYNLVSILSLAFGLVGFTVFGGAAVARLVLPGFDWRLGMVLGALVAPTDTVAATSIARRLGLPRRVVDVLEGESLVNDATGLLALEFAVAMVVSGETPAVGFAALRFLWLIVGGLGIGLVIARVVEWIELRIDDAPIEIIISILVPYAAYFAADEARASGILAVVAAGLYLSRQSARFFSPRVRIQLYSVWNAITFILNGLVFVLVGLQLPYVLAGVRGRHGLGRAIEWSVLFAAAVILLRLLWIFPGARFSFFIRRRLLHQQESIPDTRSIFVVGWTGMRGVVALAAAIGLPAAVGDGSPFPRRDLIVFITFAVIVITLVAQGLSLPPLIRMLGLAKAAGPDCEEVEARRIVLQTALEHVQDARAKDDPATAGVYDDVAQHYRERIEALAARLDGGRGEPPRKEKYDELTRELLQVERDAAVRLRNEGRIGDEVLRQLEHDIDLREARLTGGVLE
jgi:CPA1 family monovalent cation:H+ antiporter